MAVITGGYEDEARPAHAPLHDSIPAWPDWDGTDFDSVVRYVNPAELEDAAVVPWVRFNSRDEDDPFNLLGQAFRFLQSLGIRYGLEPWISDRGQRIRWPALIRRDCGTCLDIAILFTSILLRCQFRTLLLFAKGTVSTESHVVVLVDLRAPLQDLMLQTDTARVPFSYDGVNGRHTSTMPNFVLPDGFVACDPTTATDNGSTYEDALNSALQLLDDNTRYREFIVLDIASAIHDQVGAPYPIPNNSAGASAVWTHLPARYVPPPLMDTDSLVESIRAADRRIAILGASGTGKSTIAYMSAARWDNGYGWFLNAADRSTLQSELSSVELMHRSRSLAPRQVEDDQVALSRAALQRLRQSHMPWVVIVDNADNEPNTIVDLLPEPVWPGQVVIVTSTHPAWSSWSNHCWTLGPVSQDGSRITKAPADSRFVPRRAIEVDLRSRFIRKGVDVQADDLSSLVSLSKRRLTKSARQLCLDIAWAPAAPLDFDSLTDGSSSAHPVLDLHELEQLGLVGTARSGQLLVTMHRSIASQIRMWDPNSPGARALRLSHLMTNNYMIEILTAKAEESVLKRLITLAETSALAKGLPRALYMLSEVLEARGMSSDAARIADLCLNRGADQLVPSQATLARLRVIRHIKNHVKEVSLLEDALHSVTKMIEELPVDADREGWLLKYQCIAMQGHLRRQWSKRSRHGEQLITELTSAKALLIESVSGRAQLVGMSDWRRSVERELSLFNIAAISLDLGKCSAATPRLAAAFLGDSLQMYTAVRNAVHDTHGSSVNHPRHAAAEYGRALCFYYSALLGIRPALRSEAEILGIPSEFELSTNAEPSAADFDTEVGYSGLLIAAHEAILTSLRERMSLQVGQMDGPDVVKCLRLSAEIVAARIVWAEGGRLGVDVRELSARAVEKSLLQTEQNFRDDWKKYGEMSVGKYESVYNEDQLEMGYRRTWHPEDQS